MYGHDIVWYLIVGFLAGCIGSFFVQGRGMGLVRDIAVGMMGAVIGGYFSDELGIPINGFLSALGMSVIGAVLFLAVLRAFLFSRRRRA